MIVCDADKEKRTVTFYVREGFGNGKTNRGLKTTPDAEINEAIQIFRDSIDIIIGKKMSVLPIERFVTIEVM